MVIVQMSLSASILIVAVICIRALTLYKLPKKTFLVLWGIVVFRLLIPFSVPSQFSIYTGIDFVKRIFTGKTASPVLTQVIPNISNIRSTWQSGDINASTILISPIKIVWLIGVCVCVLFFTVAYIKCRREFKMSLPVENDFVVRWLSNHPLHRPMQIRYSSCIKAPLTYGIFHPVILLPKETDWTDETKLRYVFFP